MHKNPPFSEERILAIPAVSAGKRMEYEALFCILPPPALRSYTAALAGADPQASGLKEAFLYFRL